MKGRLVTHLRSFQYLSTWAAEQREEEGRWEKMVSMTSGGNHIGSSAETEDAMGKLVCASFSSATEQAGDFK
jgi:hypothetical protein